MASDRVAARWLPGWGLARGPRAPWAALLALALACLSSPSLAEEEWAYRVMPGDSLWKISQRHLTGLQWVGPLQRLNAVADPYALPPGRELRVPLAWTRRSPAQAVLETVTGEVGLAAGGVAAIAPARAGQTLSSGDRLVTGADGYVLLRYPDESSTQVFGLSELALQELEMLGDQAQLRIRLVLDEGRSEHQVEPVAVGRSNDMRVRAPYATTSVRGTHFRVASQAEAGVSLVGVLQGAVHASATPSADRGLQVVQGQGVVARAGDQPLRAVALLPAPVRAADGEPLQRLPLVLRLHPVEGAVAYSGDVALDPEHHAVVAGFAGSDTELVLPDLPDGEYWLRVRAIDADGLEGLDGGSRLVVHARPEPPFLTAPVAGTVVATGRPVQFRWTSQADAIGYRFELARAGDGAPEALAEWTDVAVDGPAIELTWRAPLGTGRHLWRVRSVAASGRVGPFGDWQALEAVPPGPGVSPPALQTRSLSLAWSDSGTQMRYRLQLARNAQFDPLLVDEVVDQPGYTMARPRHGTYHVRVARITATNSQEPWGTAQQFEVPRLPPKWLLGPAGFLLLLLL
ncbi:MAG: FecR domain-containing protein [Xanthomonadales bacterium]|nr:FecR domain-containing protein [Xanthomonadales bacterium]